MACTGHTNSCPSHPGYDPPLSPVDWTYDPIDTDDEVYGLDFNEMKSYTDAEYTRRALTPSAGFPPDDKETDDIVYGSDYISVWDHIKSIDSTGSI